MLDAYGRWFPDYPGQSMYQDPAVMAKFGPQMTGNPANQQRAQQPITPPTIHAEIIQIGSVNDAERYPLAAGGKQMFVTQDESAFILKEQQQTGYILTIYDRRPPEPPAPAIDPAKFVTHDELEERLAKLAAARPARTATAKEEK